MEICFFAIPGAAWMPAFIATIWVLVLLVIVFLGRKSIRFLRTEILNLTKIPDHYCPRHLSIESRLFPITS